MASPCHTPPADPLCTPALPRSEAPGARTAADIRANLAARGARLQASAARQLRHRWAGNQPVLVVRDEEGELRAFRNVCRHRGSRCSPARAVQQAPPLPLPRLDLQARRHPDRRARGARLRRRARQERARADAGARGDDVRRRVREPRPRCRAAGRARRRPAGAARPLRHRVARAVHAATTARQPANWKVVVDNYLEGYHMPIAHPGADAAARLQALHGRACTTTGSGSRRRCATTRRSNRSSGLPAARRSRCRGCGATTGASGATCSSTRTRDRHLSRPGRTWQIRPTGVDRRRPSRCYRPDADSSRTRFAQRLNRA